MFRLRRITYQHCVDYNSRIPSPHTSEDNPFCGVVVYAAVIKAVVLVVELFNNSFDVFLVGSAVVFGLRCVNGEVVLEVTPDVVMAGAATRQFVVQQSRHAEHTSEFSGSSSDESA